MSADGVKKWRANTKKKLVDAFGGKCNKCQYDACLDALDLHHVKEKSFSFSSALSRPKKWELLVAEAKKCVLLCCRCHRELHAGVWSIDMIEVKEPVFPQKNDVTGSCPICKKDLYGTVTCSRACAAVKRSKITWPSKDELVELKKKMNRNQIADMLGVTEMAVRKREKKYEILPCHSTVG